MAHPPRRKPRSLAEYDPNAEAGGTPAAPVALAEVPQAPIVRHEEGVPLSYLVTDADRQRLKMYCIEKRISMQQLQHMMANAYLTSHGLPPLEPQTANRASGGRKK